MKRTVIAASLISLLLPFLAYAAEEVQASPASIAYGILIHTDEEGAPEGFTFGKVLVSSRFMVPHIEMSADAAEIGDIVKVELPTAGRKARILEVAAKDQNPSCKWVDENADAYLGGVVCNGWSYKSLPAAKK